MDLRFSAPGWGTAGSPLRALQVHESRQPVAHHLHLRKLAVSTNAAFSYGIPCPLPSRRGAGLIHHHRYWGLQILHHATSAVIQKSSKGPFQLGEVLLGVCEAPGTPEKVWAGSCRGQTVLLRIGRKCQSPQTGVISASKRGFAQDHPIHIAPSFILSVK